MHRHALGRGGRYAATYVAVAALWIVVSSSLTRVVGHAAAFEMAKGLGFVVTTGIVLFLVLVAHDRMADEAAGRTRRLVEAAGDVAFRYRLTPPVGYDYISARVTDWLGLTPEEHYRRPDLESWLVHPADRQALADLMSVPSAHNVPLRWVAPDGRLLHSLHDVCEVLDRRGRIVAIDGRIRNVTDQRRDHAESAITDAILASSADGAGDAAIASRVCERIVALMEIDLAWIGAVAPDGTIRVVGGAGSGIPDGDEEHRWDRGVRSRGPIGLAIRDARPSVMCPGAPGYASWRQRVMHTGAMSALAVPLLRAGRPVGVLGVSTRLGNPFDRAHVDRFTRIAERLALVMRMDARAASSPPPLGGRDAGFDRFDVVAALADGRIEPFWQPQVRSRDGRVVGLEALVRGRTVAGEVVAPDVLLALAEEHGVMVQLGRVMRSRTFAETGRWLSAGVEHVAINVSVVELVEPGFVLEVLGLIADHHVDPAAIEIEVVETAPLDARAVRALAALADADVRIAIDDYGSGWASLGHLAQLPAATMKIDRVFIRDLGASHRADQLVRSTFDLARGLGLTSVAEGVETVEQARALQAMGCDLLQGFLFARPLPTGDVEQVLDRFARAGSMAGNWLDAVAS